ncbi:MAG: hypothetical protein KY392_00560 [Chloroflexi bacterium]|nr:hypothetical protein [Chloroflexota bacterium]
MNAVSTAAHALPATPIARIPLLGALRGLLVSQAVLTLGLAIFLSLVAAGLRDALGGDAGRAAETSVRFAAGAAFLFAVFAAIAARGARRRRRWSWTMAAVLQLVLAIGTSVAVMLVEWHPIYLFGFALAGITMVVLSTGVVRRALHQV